MFLNIQILSHNSIALNNNNFILDNNSKDSNVILYRMLYKNAMQSVQTHLNEVNTLCLLIFMKFSV